MKKQLGLILICGLCMAQLNVGLASCDTIKEVSFNEVFAREKVQDVPTLVLSSDLTLEVGVLENYEPGEMKGLETLMEKGEASPVFVNDGTERKHFKKWVVVRSKA